MVTTAYTQKQSQEDPQVCMDSTCLQKLGAFPYHDDRGIEDLPKTKSCAVVKTLLV